MKLKARTLSFAVQGVIYTLAASTQKDGEDNWYLTTGHTSHSRRVGFWLALSNKQYMWLENMSHPKGTVPYMKEPLVLSQIQDNEAYLKSPEVIRTAYGLPEPPP